MAEAPPDAQARAAAIVVALGAGAGAATAAAGAAAVLVALARLLLSWGYRRQTVRWATRVVVVARVRVKVTRTRDPDGPDDPAGDATTGPAGAATERAADVFAAWFIEATTARVEAAVAAGVDPDEAQARESRHLDQHLDAQERRARAAERVDAQARKGGTATDDQGRPILGWKAHDDDRVTPECVAADGAWFYAHRPPLIGYPGMPHGGTCRCWAAPITATAAAAGRTVDEAVRATLAADPDHRTHPRPGRRTA